MQLQADSESALQCFSVAEAWLQGGRTTSKVSSATLQRLARTGNRSGTEFIPIFCQQQALLRTDSRTIIEEIRRRLGLKDTAIS